MGNAESHDLDSTLSGAVAAIGRAAGQAVVSISLYGSVARGSSRPGIADVNLLIVLTQVEPSTLAALRQALEQITDVQVTPYLITEREWPAVLEAFPTRVLEMQRGYRVLQGKDFLGPAQVDKAQLVIRVRQELLNILLRFRHALLRRSDAEALERDLHAFLQPCFKTLRSLLYARTGQHIESRKELIAAVAREFGVASEPLLQLSAWRSGQLSLVGEQWPEAAAAFLAALQQIADKLND